MFLRLALLALALTAGCTARQRCMPSSPSEVELRDGNGTLLLAARRSGRTGSPSAEGTLDLCDGNHALLGQARVTSSTVKLVDRGGGERLGLSAESKNRASGVRMGQPRLRLYREGTETHVLQPDGVRFGTASTARPGVVQVFDRASAFIATVTPRGEDQSIAAPDGGVRWLVMRATSPVAAAMFALPNLDLDEQLALYLFISRAWP
jgi:hypothetical protein